MARHSTTGVRGLFKTNDRYEIDLRWTDPSGAPKRYRFTFPDGTRASVAKARATAILNAALSGELDPDAPAPVAPELLAATFDRYLADCETAGLRSVAARRTHAKALGEFFGARALADLTPFDVERFKRDRREGGSKPATVNRHVATLKNLCGWAVRDGTIDRGRAAELREVKLLREPEGRVRYLSPEEEATVDENLTGWLRPLALACKFTGARLSEITGLRWRDVDRRAGVVRFTRTKTNRTREVPIVPLLGEILDARTAPSGIGHEVARSALAALLERHGTTTDTASAIGVTETAVRKWQARGVPLARREQLTRLAGVRVRPGAVEPVDPAAYVFAVPRRQGRAEPAKRSEDARRRDVTSRAWAAFCERVGLLDLHAHDLRHHAATMIRRAGGGLDTVAKVLGHTNVRTAARYAHVEVEDTRRFLIAASLARPLPAASTRRSRSTRKKKAVGADA